MDGHAKPKHLVLQEFAEILLQRNPMNLRQDSPLEYELEALSILSRFTEAALQLADDEAIITEIATGVVKQTLEFWFDNVNGVDCEALARELLATFKASFGQAEREQPVETKQVTSITIGE